MKNEVTFLEGQPFNVIPGTTQFDDFEGLQKNLSSAHIRKVHIITFNEVYLENGSLVNLSSAPNWQGGETTFASGHLEFRSSKHTRDSWTREWIVGLCDESCGKNVVLFAGEVEHHFHTNMNLYLYYKWYSRTVLAAKKATHSEFGDIYTPFVDGMEHDTIYEAFNYYNPIHRHVNSNWKEDIEYRNEKSSRPRSFIFNPCWVFTKPNVVLKGRNIVGQIKQTTTDKLCSGLKYKGK